MTRIILVFAIVTGHVCGALTLDAKQGKTEFLAVGRPSAIKINGKGTGPTGDFKFKREGDVYLMSGEAIVDLSSLDTDIDMRDRHMKEKYLEVEKYKDAKISFADVKVSAEKVEKGGEFELMGKLNLHGEEKALPIAMNLENKDGQIKAKAKFKVKLSEFKIDIPKYAGITVADEVHVTTETALPFKSVSGAL